MAEQVLAGGVRLVTEADVATVWLDRPEVRNAQTFATWASLAEVASVIPTTTLVVLLRGAGKDFSAGLDLRMLRRGGLGEEGALEDLLDRDDAGVEEQLARFQLAFTAWRALDAVVVAVVQGRAIGAGFQLALAADLRMATHDATLTMAEVSLGLVPDLGGTSRLSELVGSALALELCVTARPVVAAEALRLGLVNQLVPAVELEEAVAGLVTSLRQHPPEAVRAVKRLFAGAPRSTADQLAAERGAQVALLRGIAARR